MRLAIVLLLAATVSTSAQSATDNELFAGYCVGASDRGRDFRARLQAWAGGYRLQTDRLALPGRPIEELDQGEKQETPSHFAR